MNSLPIHPVTGLKALGIGKRGPIWPQLGASEDVIEEPAPVGDVAPPAAEPDPETEPEPKTAKPDGWSPPASQEELDRIIARRLARETAKNADALSKAAKYDELEAAKKSNEERLADELAVIRKENDGLKLDQLRGDVAREKGLTAKLAKRLTGTTREEMEADADDLLEDMPKPPEPPVTPKRMPKEDLRGGGRPDEEPEETDPIKLAARIRRR